MNATAEEGKASKPEVHFAQVPIDVLHAVCVELGGTRGAVLASVLAARYGVAKAPETTVDRKAIARVAGSTPHAVTVAVGRLCGSNILARSEGGIRFNGRYSTWAGMDAERAREIRRTARPKGSHRRDLSGHRAETSGHTAETSGHSGVTDRSHSGDQKSRPCDLPLKKREIYTRETISQSACEPPANTSRSFPDPLPAKPAPGLDYHPDATPEVRKQLIEAADKYRGWGTECSKALGDGADPEHVKAALERAEKAGAGHWNWVKTVLADYRRFGVPKPKPKPGGRFATRADVDAFVAECQANMKAYEERQRQERLAAVRGAVA